VPDRSGYYILTGDFQQGAGVWVADKDFVNVAPMVRGDQDSRACWIQSLSDRVYLATDRQDSFNYLCELQDGRLQKLFPRAGSSIYHSQNYVNNGMLVFSTAVEPNSSNSRSISSMLSLKKGDGILSNYSCIYAGNASQGFRIIFSRKKDILPFGLFQFGNILFPSGVCNRHILHFYCVGLSGADNVTYAIKSENLYLMNQ
jgi:hypothetical protein